jgi:hypothetical protein
MPLRLPLRCTGTSQINPNSFYRCKQRQERREGSISRSIATTAMIMHHDHRALAKNGCEDVKFIEIRVSIVASEYGKE